MKKYLLNGNWYGIEVSDSLEIKYFKYIEPFDLHFSGEWVSICKEEFLESLDKEIKELYNKVKEYENLKARIENDNGI